MCRDCFKLSDYELLLDLLIPYDAAFPQLEDRLNKFFLDLNNLMVDDAKFQSFKEFRAFSISARADRYLELTIGAPVPSLALLSLSLTTTITRVPRRFPELTAQSAAVMNEILNAVDNLNGGTRL